MAPVQCSVWLSDIFAAELYQFHHAVLRAVIHGERDDAITFAIGATGTHACFPRRLHLVMAGSAIGFVPISPRGCWIPFLFEVPNGHAVKRELSLVRSSGHVG